MTSKRSWTTSRLTSRRRSSGRDRLADLTAEPRSRLDELRGESKPEPAQTVVENLQARLDDLAAAVDDEVEEGRAKAMGLIDNLE